MTEAELILDRRLAEYREMVERRMLLLEQQGRGHPPIFRRMLNERYAGRDDTPETFAVRAYMRGFTYGILLEESVAYRPTPRLRLISMSLERPDVGTGVGYIERVHYDHTGSPIWDERSPLL